MSQDEPGFKYINMSLLASLFISNSNADLEFTAAVLTVLLTVVADLEDKLCSHPSFYLVFLFGTTGRELTSTPT